MTDYSHRLLPKFGKMRGLWRCHWLLSDALETALTGNAEVVAAQLTQACKCLHQVALDGGSWEAAELLLETPNPLETEGYAGEPFEMEGIARYRKMVREMATGRSRQRKSSSDSSHGPGEDDTQRKRKKKKKKKPEGPPAAP